MRKEKNNAIYFWKFVYAFFVMYYHFYEATEEHFLSGRYGVEFYLLTAGAFLFMAYERQTSAGEGYQSPYSFLKKRFSRFFPWAFTGLLFAAAATYGFLRPVGSFEKLVDALSNDIWEILLIKMNGMNYNRPLLNGPAWTLSSMLITQFFIWSCLYHFREKFIDLLMPLTIVVGLGMWRFIDDASVKIWIGFTTFGTFRAWIVICTGYYALRMAYHLKGIHFNNKGKLVLTAIELLCHLFAIWVMLSKNTRYYQWCCLLVFIIATAIELSGHSRFNDFLNKIPFIGFLGELSMCIYLTHGTVWKIWLFRYPDPYEMYSHMVSFTLAVFASSLGMYYAVKYGTKLWKRLMNAAKNTLTYDEQKMITNV